METAKTIAPGRDWKAEFERIASVDANTLRIPLTKDNVFTFATLRRMRPIDVDIVIETLGNWRETLTQREPPPVIEPEEPYALHGAD